MLNRVLLSGRLVADPEVRCTQNGVTVVNFTVAVDRDYISQRSERREADFVDIVAWRGLGELAVTYLHKGNRVNVDGKLETSSYTAKDGTRRRRVQVVADSLYFLDAKPKESEASQPEGPVGSEDLEEMQPPSDDDLPL